MKDHDESFEKYLREFVPKRPPALGLTGMGPRLWMRRLAAAAVVVVAVGGLWVGAHKRGNPQGVGDLQAIGEPKVESGARLLLIPLTRTALKDPEELDTELEEASRRLLPNFRKSSSTLRVLTKERLSGE